MFDQCYESSIISAMKALQSRIEITAEKNLIAMHASVFAYVRGAYMYGYMDAKYPDHEWEHGPSVLMYARDLARCNQELTSALGLDDQIVLGTFSLIDPRDPYRIELDVLQEEYAAVVKNTHGFATAILTAAFYNVADNWHCICNPMRRGDMMELLFPAGNLYAPRVLDIVYSDSFTKGMELLCKGDGTLNGKCRWELQQESRESVHIEKKPDAGMNGLAGLSSLARMKDTPATSENFNSEKLEEDAKSVVDDMFYMAIRNANSYTQKLLAQKVIEILNRDWL